MSDSRMVIIGDALERATVRRATLDSGFVVDEQPAPGASIRELETARLVVACGLEHARAVSALKGTRTSPSVLVALRTNEAPRAIPPGVDDYTHLDHEESEIGARLELAMSRASSRRMAEVDAVQLTEIAGAIDELIGITTADGTRNLYLSPAYDVITGASRHDIMADPRIYLRLVHPDDHHVLYEAHRQKDVLHEYRYRIVRDDGQTRWLHSRAFPVRHDDGTTARIVTITRDVTDRKQAEDDAEAKRGLLEGVTTALTTMLTAASSHLSIDRALAVIGPAAVVDRVYVARHHRDDAGELRVVVTHEWSVPGPPSLLDVAGGTVGRPSLPDARPLLALVERGQSVAIVRSELPASVQARLEPSGVRSMLVVPVILDGTCWGQVGFVDCHAERHWDGSVRATLEATAAAVGSAIARERAMEALAEQVHRVRSLYESAANRALTAEEQLSRLLAAGARLLDVEVSAIIRDRPAEGDVCEVVHVHPSDAPLSIGQRLPLARDLWDSSVAENRPMAMDDVVGTRFEDTEPHRDFGFRAFLGAPIWIRGQMWGGLTFVSTKPRARPFRETDLDLARLLASGVAHVLEQMESEEERRALDASLRETQKLESLGLLAGGIAHDFNNLLMGIMGHASVATREGSDGSAVVRESLEQITAITRRAATLTRQLLAYAGRDRVRIQPTSLASLVREMSELLLVVLPKDARLETRVEDPLALVLGDAAQLQQVVMNLITNAGDALSGRPGTISARVWSVAASELPRNGRVVPDVPAERYVVFEIADTGAGMDAATLERAFEPFFSTKGPGRGLGLAAVLGIVRMHHGALDVKSTPGVGTAFRLFLPAASASPRAVGVEATSLSPPSLDVRVLVVDDNDQIRATVKRALTMSGADVLVASDGVEALEHVSRERERIAVVVLDLTMPRMDGARAHERIRELVPDMPIILMSGYAQGEHVERVIAEPRTKFLAKPFDATELLTALRALVATVR